RVVSWLLDRQLPNGSVPLAVAVGEGETGQTARALRALCHLDDPTLADRAASMAAYLRDTARPQGTGVAWACYPPDQTVVTGSTSLAITALIEHGQVDDVVGEGMRYLLASQDSTGGWAEVPGDRPTIQNTFQTVRAIHTAQRAGIADPAVATATLGSAREWFRGATGRQPPRTLLTHAFAVRTADQLGLLREERYERLTRQLAERRREFLDPAADMYADTEIVAIALLEASRSVDAMPDGGRAWPWRWQLPHPAPPFLARSPYAYELMYGAIRSRRWVRVVDVLVHRRVIDHVAGAVLGAVTSIGIVSDYVVEALVAGGGLRGAWTVTIVAVLVLSWQLVKAAAVRSWRGGVGTSAGSLATALLLSAMLDPGPVVPTFVALVGLRWLVIDAVAFTADSSGLLNRLLPNRA
ncbi:MAG: prenyltransferase/squalene oxidase repeat-containing protein, partial [Natronosporangium sp.]